MKISLVNENMDDRKREMYMQFLQYGVLTWPHKGQGYVRPARIEECVYLYLVCTNQYGQPVAQDFLLAPFSRNIGTLQNICHNLFNISREFQLRFLYEFQVEVTAETMHLLQDGITVYIYSA